MSEKISIVRRLRLEANALGEFQAYASRDYGKMLLDAADEIERLTAERDEIQRELLKAETESSMIRVECGVIAAERDEARRMCCERAAMDESGYVKHGDMLHFAESRGWNCFVEDGK